MDENINVATETPVTDEVVEIVNTPAVQPEEKKGLTGAQKAVGLGVIGFAIFGIVELILKGIKLVKKGIAKIKEKKAEKAAEKTEKAPEKVEGDVVEVDNETMDKIQGK